MTGTIAGQELIVKKLFRTETYAVTDFVWGYLQVESVNAKMCCGNFDMPIGRLILRKQDGDILTLQYEGVEKPKKLLEELTALNPAMDVGFTEANRKKYMEQEN